MKYMAAFIIWAWTEERLSIGYELNMWMLAELNMWILAELNMWKVWIQTHGQMYLWPVFEELSVEKKSYSSIHDIYIYIWNVITSPQLEQKEQDARCRNAHEY